MTDLDWKADLRELAPAAAQDFLDACTERARSIAESASGEITLLLSGGVQSEWLARLFQKSDIPFQALIYRFNSANHFDIDGGLEFCRKNGIRHEVRDWDVRSFLSEEVYGLAKKCRIPDLRTLAAFQMCQMTPGHAVRAGGLPTAVWDTGHLKISSAVRWDWERRLGAAFASQFTLAFFSSHDPIIRAYLGHPLFKEWIETSPILGLENSREWREIILRSDFDEVLPRASWTGMENVLENLNEVTEKLRGLFKDRR